MSSRPATVPEPRSAPDHAIGDLIEKIRTAFTSGRLPEAVRMLDLADSVAMTEIERLRFARVRAVTLSRAGDHRAAIEALDGVAESWLQLGDVLAASGAASMEAYAHNMLGELDRALDGAAFVLTIMGEVDEVRADGAAAERLLAATVCNTLGLMFLDLEAADLAIGQFRRTIDLTGDDDPVMMGIARANLASALLRKAMRRRSSDGTVTDADAELEGAERLARQLLASDVPPRRRVEAASILAAVLLNTDRPHEAAEVLDQHRQFEHLVDDARALVDWNLLWARAHRSRGRLDDASASVERALERARTSDDRIAITFVRRERSRIKEAAGDLAGALADLRAADDGSRELRSSRFEALIEQLMRRAQLESSQRRLERQAEAFGAERSRLERAIETDPLTGLGNRRRLVAALEAIEATPGPVSVVMIDVDRFKEFNDDLGHAFGDQVLVDVASALSRLAREGDVVCRPGGDEFVMLLPGADHRDARAVTARVREAVGGLAWDVHGQRVSLPGRRSDEYPEPGPIGVSVSIGVASGTSGDVVTMMGEADLALLDAKRRGRDRISVA